ncbi:MAG TPA: hypothetical protein VJ385_12580, partial [Fibrobacteria bacterium]|nr:hypothetical protein [Fibrobacteria bacterium]
MKKTSLSICALTLALCPFALLAEEEPRIEAQPLHIGALQEFGMVEKGFYYSGTENSAAVTRDW